MGSYRNLEVSTVVLLWAQLFWDIMWWDISAQQSSKEQIINLNLQQCMKIYALPCDEIPRTKTFTEKCLT